MGWRHAGAAPRRRHHRIPLPGGRASDLTLLPSAVDGLKDLVLDGINERLISPDDPQMLLCAWRRLQDDPTLRRNITANASAEAEQSPWPAIVSRLDEIYQDALARR